VGAGEDGEVRRAVGDTRRPILPQSNRSSPHASAMKAAPNPASTPHDSSTMVRLGT